MVFTSISLGHALRYAIMHAFTQLLGTCTCVAQLATFPGRVLLMQVFELLPPATQLSLLLERDPHGNVQVSWRQHTNFSALQHHTRHI